MLNIIYKAFIPSNLNQTHTYPYAKNIVNAAFMAFIASPVFAGIYYVLNFHAAAYAILLLGGIILSAAWLLKYWGSLFLSRELIASSLFICFTWLTYKMGGITSPSTYWLILPSLSSIILGSITSGFFWGLASIITIIFIYLLQLFYKLPISPITNILFLHAFSASGLIFVIMNLIYFFENGKCEFELKIEEINHQLQLSNEKIYNLLKKSTDTNQVKSHFLSNMSHALRNPIHTIIQFAKLSLEKKCEITHHQNDLYEILSNANHLSQMISDMLDISKFEAGIHEFHPTQVYLNPLVQSIKDIFHRAISEKKLELTISIDPALTLVYIDPNRLKQIVFHLISNAIKFTPMHGKVEIHILPINNDAFKIEVSDTGVGIREEDIKTIFQSFYQIDSTKVRHYPGAGIGLTLIKCIVEAQNGQYGANSQFGKGSVFFVTLPRTSLSPNHT